MIPIVIVLAYSFKFKMGWVLQNIFSIQKGEIYAHAQVEPYLALSGLIIVLWIGSFYVVGLYRLFTGVMPEVNEFIKVVKGVSIGTLEVVLVSFLFRSIPDSRTVLLYAWGLGICFLFLGRYFIFRLQLFLLSKGIGARSTIIIGSGDLGQDIAERILQLPTLGLHYLGTVDDAPPVQYHYHLKDRFKWLGTLDSFTTCVDPEKVSIVFVTRALSAPFSLRDLITYCEQHGIECRVLSELSFQNSGQLSLEDFDGLAYIVRKRFHFHAFDLGLKRVLDIITGLFIGVLSLPVCLLAMLWIKIVSPGPVLFSQDRVGQDGKVFTLLKFRTMIPNAEALTGPVFVDEEGDSRCIPGGKFIRRFSIDEFPQLWNVLKGDMSMVGPRPERAFFVETYIKTIPDFNYRHLLKPGITGWAQVNGRSVLTRRPEHKIKYDLYYIKNWTLLLDIKILFKTVFFVLLGIEAC